MEISDADFMLELKNYPETRQFALISHDEISKENHYKWLPNNLQYFQVLYSQNHLYGAVRIQDNEVSIWINKEYWGKGMASFVLEKVSKKGMWAKIVPDNISSIRAFINAGFRPVSFNGKYYIFQR